MADTTETKIDELSKELSNIELEVMTTYSLADAIREGSKTTTQEVGAWGSNGSACALHAGIISAVARGYME